MEKMRTLLREITQLTYEIENQYPELYQYLEEDPITIPAVKVPEVNVAVLNDYLESLKELLKHHLETHSLASSNKAQWAGPATAGS